MLTPDWLDVMGSVSGSTGPLAPPPSQRSVVGHEVCGPVDQDQADGDRVILLPDINSRELRNFIDNLYSEYPCHGWSDVETQQQRMIVETEDGQPHHHRGQ